MHIQIEDPVIALGRAIFLEEVGSKSGESWGRLSPDEVAHWCDRAEKILEILDPLWELRHVPPEG